MFNVVYTAHPTEMPLIHSAFVASRLHFGNQVNAQQVNAPAGHDAFHVVYQDIQSVYLAHLALTKSGKPGWINVMTPSGPQFMTLTDYLRQNGYKV
jgi:hypothetical protein